MKYAAAIAVAMLLLAAGIGSSLALGASTDHPATPPGQGECEHGNSGQECNPDPQPGHGEDCDQHGQPQGGVNEDHCLPDETTPTDTHPAPPPPPPTHPTDTTPTPPPPSHDCTFVGADKDGGHDINGGTNDDCAPAPPKTVTPPPVSTTTVPPAVVTTPPPTTTTTPPTPPPPKPKPPKPPKPPIVCANAKSCTPPKPPKPPVPPKPPHVCTTLADGTQRAWYKGGNGIKPGCYPIIHGSG